MEKLSEAVIRLLFKSTMVENLPEKTFYTKIELTNRESEPLREALANYRKAITESKKQEIEDARIEVQDLTSKVATKIIEIIEKVLPVEQDINNQKELLSIMEQACKILNAQNDGSTDIAQQAVNKFRVSNHPSLKM